MCLRKQKRLSDAQNAAQDAGDVNDAFNTAAALSDQDQAKLIDEINQGRSDLLQQVEDIDSELELQVLTGAITSSARTLDQAGVDVAKSLMDGKDFENLVSKAAANAGVSADLARATLQKRFLWRLRTCRRILAKTDALGEEGNAIAATGDYAAAAATDASARAQAATDRAEAAA